MPGRPERHAAADHLNEELVGPAIVGIQCPVGQLVAEQSQGRQSDRGSRIVHHEIVGPVDAVYGDDALVGKLDALEARPGVVDFGGGEAQAGRVRAVHDVDVIVAGGGEDVQLHHGRGVDDRCEVEEIDDLLVAVECARGALSGTVIRIDNHLAGVSTATGGHRGPGEVRFPRGGPHAGVPVQHQQIAGTRRIVGAQPLSVEHDTHGQCDQAVGRADSELVLVARTVEDHAADVGQEDRGELRAVDEDLHQRAGGVQLDEELVRRAVVCVVWIRGPRVVGVDDDAEFIYGLDELDVLEVGGDHPRLDDPAAARPGEVEPRRSRAVVEQRVAGIGEERWIVAVDQQPGGRIEAAQAQVRPRRTAGKTAVDQYVGGVRTRRLDGQQVGGSGAEDGDPIVVRRVARVVHGLHCADVYGDSEAGNIQIAGNRRGIFERQVADPAAEVGYLQHVAVGGIARRIVALDHKAGAADVSRHFQHEAVVARVAGKRVVGGQSVGVDRNRVAVVASPGVDDGAGGGRGAGHVDGIVTRAGQDDQVVDAAGLVAHAGRPKAGDPRQRSHFRHGGHVAGRVAGVVQVEGDVPTGVKDCQVPAYVVQRAGAVAEESGLVAHRDGVVAGRRRV